MNKPICIRVQWSFGGEKKVTCRESDTLGDVLEENGFSALHQTKLVVIYKGKVVNPDFTMAHFSVRENDVIVCMRKRLPDPTRKEKLFAILSQPNYRQNTAKQQPIEAKPKRTILEKAKCDDRSFNTWEITTQMPLVYNEMYKAQCACIKEDNEPQKTVISETPKLSTEPLPTLRPEPGSVLFGNFKLREFEPSFESEKKNLNLFIKKE